MRTHHILCISLYTHDCSEINVHVCHSRVQETLMEHPKRTREKNIQFKLEIPLEDVRMYQMYTSFCIERTCASN